MELKVLNRFVDKFDASKTYQIGDSLISSDIVRINDLLKRGLCEIYSIEDPIEEPAEEPAEEQVEESAEEQAKVKFNDVEYDIKTMIASLNQIGVKVSFNSGVDNLNSKIASLNDDQQKSLLELLDKE